MGIKFGTGGWRSKINDGFILKNVKIVANAIADYIVIHKLYSDTVIIGYDNRAYSSSASEWVAQELLKRCIKVTIFDMSVTTPLVMSYVKNNNLSIGIMITASHNPQEFNGIKVFTRGGRDATKDVTDEIESYTWMYESETYKDEDIYNYNYVSASNYYNKFIISILNNFSVDTIGRADIKILFDSMGGTGDVPFDLMLNMIGVKYTNYKDTSISIPCPTAETLPSFENAVVSGNYDFGVAFDGDADRLGIVDENGKFVDGNDLICMVCWYMYEYRGLNTDIAKSCCTTNRLSKIAEKYGYICHDTNIGVKYLISKMKESGAKFSGEQNGGMIFAGHTLGKDAIYTVCMFIEMISITHMSVSSILSHIEKLFGKVYCISDTVTYESDVSTVIKIINDKNNIPKIEKEIESISYEDGCKITYTDRSFVIYRLSGTEPLIRVMSDAYSRDEAEMYVNKCKEMLHHKITE